MIDSLFVKSPSKELYQEEKENIANDSIVFIDDTEQLVAQDTEYQFVPSNGTTGQVLTKGENGPEWKDAESGSQIPPSDYDSKFVISTEEGPKLFEDIRIFDKTSYGHEDKIHLILSNGTCLNFESDDGGTTIMQDHYEKVYQEDDCAVLTHFNTLGGFELNVGNDGEFTDKVERGGDGPTIFRGYISNSDNHTNLDVLARYFTWNGNTVLTEADKYKFDHLWLHYKAQGYGNEFPENVAIITTTEEYLQEYGFDTKIAFRGKNGVTISGAFEKIGSIDNNNAQILEIGYEGRSKGSNKITSLATIPVDKLLCIASISTSQALGNISNLADGDEINIIVKNTGSASITIDIPSTYMSNGLESIKVDAGCYGEINILSDGTSLYLKAVDGTAA